MANWGKILSRGNVEDRRGMAPAAISGISLTGLALLMLFNVLSGGNLTDVLQQFPDVSNIQQPSEDTSQYQGQDSYEVFASTVLGSTNDAWTQTFRTENKSYFPPKLVLFRIATESSCGGATSDVGPHYCPPG